MALRRPRRLMNQINVVPYIDVMLVLLVIFMITAPLINPGQIDLPSVGQGAGEVVQPIQVTLRKDNSLLLQDRAEGAREIALARDDLVRVLREKQGERPDQPVVIAADKNVRYEEVLNVMDLLQRAQVKRVGLLVRPKPG